MFDKHLIGSLKFGKRLTGIDVELLAYFLFPESLLLYPTQNMLQNMWCFKSLDNLNEFPQTVHAQTLPISLT